MTDKKVTLPLDTIIGKALIKSGQNLAQMEATVHRFYDLYDEKHAEDFMSTLFSFSELKYYALKRGVVLYRYFNIYHPEIRSYVREEELKGVNNL